MRSVPKVYLAHEAARLLRESIEKGEFGATLPGVRHLSQTLQVSIPNVVQALRILQQEGYLETQAGKPTRIIDRPRRGKRSPIKREKAISFVCFAPERLYDSTYFLGIADRLRDLGYEILLDHTTLKAWAAMGNLHHLQRQTRVECWVLIGAPASIQREFQQGGLPCLLISCLPAPGIDFPYVEIDFKALYRHAASQFINRGHRHIHLLMENRSAQKDPAAISAFTDLVLQRHPGNQGASVLQCHDGTPEHFVYLLEMLFLRKEKERPTALCIAYQNFFVLAFTWLQHRGLRIPEDVSLISRDSDDLIQYLRPRPSHYHYDTKVAQRKVVRTILAIAKGATVRKAILILSEFQEGETVGLAPGEGVQNF